MQFPRIGRRTHFFFSSASQFADSVIAVFGISLSCTTIKRCPSAAGSNDSNVFDEWASNNARALPCRSPKARPTVESRRYGEAS